MQIKITVNYHVTIGTAKTKMATPNAGKNVGKQELACIPGKGVKQYYNFEKLPLKKTKHLIYGSALQSYVFTAPPKIETYMYEKIYKRLFIDNNLNLHQQEN